MDAIYKTEFDHHSVKAIIVALNRWFGSGKMPVRVTDKYIGYSDFCIDEPYVDAQVHLDGSPSHYYNGSTWDSNADCPNRPKNAAYAAIEYLREEHGIFYSPQMEPDNDHKTKRELELEKENKPYISYLESEVERLNRTVANANMEKDRAVNQHAKDDTDYILTAFRDILDALGIDKSNYVHMDIPSLKRYTISEVSKAASNLDNYREGAVKFAADYSALQDEKESLEKEVRHLTDWNADLEKALETKREDHSRLADSYVKLCKEKEKTVRAAKENLMDILETLGVSKSFSIGQNMEFLQRHAVQRASLIKSEHDKLLKTIDASKAINDARYERLNDLAIKISTMYSKIFNPEPGETCACTAERQLEAIENYISELRNTNETLKKDVNSWIAKCNNLRIRCNSVFGAGGFITKAKINDLCDEYDIVRPGYNEDCEASLRYILDILKEYRDRCARSEEEYNRMEVNWANACSALGKADALRKDWVRKYESEHERANGEHKKADKYWAQVAGLQTRIKNLEDALNRSASNATGYEALKATLRRSLASEEALKKELDIWKQQAKAARDALKQQNEAILRKERLDEPSDNCDSEE